MCYLPSEYKVLFSPIKEYGAKGESHVLLNSRLSAQKNLISLIMCVQQSKTGCFLLCDFLTERSEKICFFHEKSVKICADALM